MIEDYNELGLPEYCLPFYYTDVGCIFIYLKPNALGQVYFSQFSYDYVSKSEAEFLGSCDFDDACDLFDPANNVIPYFFTKLGNSFTDFIQQLLFIDGENFGEVYDECFDAENPLALSRLTQYELPESKTQR